MGFVCDKIQQIGGELKRTILECLTYYNVSDIVHVKKMSVNNVYIQFKHNIERVRKHPITNTDVW